MESLVFTSLLTLLRIGGIIAAAPGGKYVSWTVKSALALALSLILLPGQAEHLAPMPESWLIFFSLSVGEFLLGFALGLGVTIVFSALILTGKLIENMSGLGAAEMFDPLTGETSGIIGRFLFFIAAAAFVCTNGHHRIIESLLQTYAAFPAGEAGIMDIALKYSTITELVSLSFNLGLQLSLSVITALLIALIAWAIISRTIPTINLMTVGWPVNMLLALGALFVSLGSIITLFCSAAQKI